MGILKKHKEINEVIHCIFLFRYHENKTKSLALMEAASHASGREYRGQQEDWFIKKTIVLLLKKTTAYSLWQNPLIRKKYFPSLKYRDFNTAAVQIK